MAMVEVTREKPAVRLRRVLIPVLSAWLCGSLLSCHRPREMVWTAEKDGTEQSYFREPNGPVYVWRKRSASGCVFGDFPDDREPTNTKVGCGETWTGSYGHTLICACVGSADGG